MADQMEYRRWVFPLPEPCPQMRELLLLLAQHRLKLKLAQEQYELVLWQALDEPVVVQAREPAQD